MYVLTELSTVYKLLTLDVLYATVAVVPATKIY